MSDNLLGQARARAAARRERQVSIPVRDLDIELLCDVPTDLGAIERLQSAAEKADKGRAKAANFARALVAAQTREIRIGDVLIEIDDEPVNFRDLALQQELSVPDAKAAVVALLGSDADIANVAAALLDSAGFTDPEFEADPI